MTIALPSFLTSIFSQPRTPSWFEIVPSLAEIYHRLLLRFPEIDHLIRWLNTWEAVERSSVLVVIPFLCIGIFSVLLVQRFGKDDGDIQLEYLERVERLRSDGIKVRGQIKAVREFARAVGPEDLLRDVSHHFFFVCSWKHPDSGELISFTSQMLHGKPNTRSLFKQGILLLVNPENPSEYLINQAHKSWH